MVSLNPHPTQGLYSLASMNMSLLPGLDSLPPPSAASKATASTTSTSDCAATLSFSEDANKKIRKPYTITKSRESWTDQEHDKFLEALQLFDRDWKKIEAFVGSKTVIQIRSHAQKYFLKIQKSGKSEHVPPPRPKKKASHPYPQKAPKDVTSQNPASYQPLASPFEPRYIYNPDSTAVFGHPMSNPTLSSWSCSSMPTMNVSQVSKAGSTTARRCFSSTNESTPLSWQTGEISDQGNWSKRRRVVPDFAQVYSFIGSVFDPSMSGHLQRLKQMDPINLETALLLMQNLAFNLMNPEFETHRRLLLSNDEDLKKANSGIDLSAIKSENAILSA